MKKTLHSGVSTATSQKPQTSFLGKCGILSLFLLGLLLSANFVTGQIIVETFENTSWTANVNFAANTSRSVASYATSAQHSITSRTAGGVVATTTAGATTNSSWPWGVGSATLTSYTTNADPARAVHSTIWGMKLQENAGYLITPVIPAGVASVTFWLSGTGGSVYVGYRTAASTSSISGTNARFNRTSTGGPYVQFPITVVGNIGAAGVPSNGISGGSFTINNSAAQQFTANIPASAASLAGQLIFMDDSESSQFTSVTIDDIVITAYVPTYYYVGGTAPSANFNDRALWSTLGVGGAAVGTTGTNITFAATDILIVDGTNVGGGATGAVNVTSAPSSSPNIGQFILRNNANFKYSGSSTRTFSIGGSIAGTDFDIQSGSTFTIASTSITTWAVQSGSTGSIAGTFDLGNQVATANVLTIGTANSITVDGTYKHGATTTTIPTLVWNTGSTCEVTGQTSSQLTGGLGQSFYNFTWNCTGSTSANNFTGGLTTVTNLLTVASTGSVSLRLTGATTFTGNYGGISVTGGTLDLNSGAGVPTINLNTGNLLVSGTGTIVSTGSGLATINFLKTTGTQTFTSTSGGISTSQINYTVGNGTTTNTLQLASNMIMGPSAVLTVSSAATLDAQTFAVSGTTTTGTISSGATLISANLAGITAAVGTATGSIQTTTARTFSTGANYTFNGAANQVTGTGLTGAANLTFSNATTVGITNSAITVTGNIAVTTGSLQQSTVGTASTITMTGNAVTLTGSGAVTGTNLGANQDLNLVYTSTSGTLTSSGTGLVRFLNITNTNTGSTIATSRGLETLFGTFTENGILQLNSGGFISSSGGAVAPTYGASSTLIYNTTGTYGVSNEWTGNGTSTGLGIPKNVTILNSTTVTLPTSSRGLVGNLTLTSGGLTLSTTSGADLYVGGNWSRITGFTVTANSRAVFFNGAGTSGSPQTISTTAANESFAFLILQRGTFVSLSSPVTVTGTFTLDGSTGGGGVLKTTSTNVLSVTNTATSGITVTGTASATNCIDGTVKWTLLSSGTNTYVFPLGKSSATTAYLPLTLVSKNTSAGNIATVEAVYTSVPTGTFDATLTAVSNTEYWSLSTTASLTTTASTVSIARTTTISPFNAIGKASAASGSYTNLGGTPASTSVSTSNDIGVTSPWFFRFATFSTNPIAVTGAASSITTSGATLNGTVNANTVSTATYFNYGLTNSPYSNLTVAATPTPVTGSSPTAISLAVSGLSANTLYHFQAGGNNGSIGVGSDATFTTLPNAPTVGTASSPTTTGFTANWTAPSPAGSATYTYTVEADDDIAFGSINATGSAIASGTLSFNFTTLSSATVYYYRVKAVNAGGSSAYSATSAPVTTTYTAGAACSGAVVVDAPAVPNTSTGITLSEWSKAPANTLTQTISGTIQTGSTWQGMFDATNLYLLIRVKDANRSSVGSNIYDQDGVEIFIDPNNTKNACCGYTTNPTQSQTRFVWNATAGSSGISGTNQITTGVTNWIATNGASDGYDLVVKLPWSSMGTGVNAIVNGRLVGFDININDQKDNTGGREATVGWSGTNGDDYQNPSGFGTTTLTVCGAPTLTTPTATSITSTSATLGATVTVINGGTLTTGGAGTAYNTSTGVVAQNALGGVTPTLNTPFTQSRTGLSPETQYFYVGYATRTDFSVNVVGTSPEGNFYTLSSPPTAQPTYTTTSSTCSSATLNWTATGIFPGAGATNTGYVLLRAVSPTVPTLTNGNGAAATSASTVVTSSIAGGTLTYTDNTAALGTTYNYVLIPYTEKTSVGVVTRNYYTTGAASQAITTTAGGSWIGGSSGDWNTGSNWCGGVPTSSSNVTIPAGVTVNIASANAVANSVTIASTGILTQSSTFNLTITSGGSFTNSGTYTASGTGALVFAGSGTLSGTSSVKNVTLSGGVDFGTATTVTGTLTINAGGFVNTNAPTYGGSSTLLYNTGGTFGRSTEWSSTSGAGYPNNVTIINGTTLNVVNGANSYKKAGGNLTVSSGSTFSVADLTTGNGSGIGVEFSGNISNDGTISLNTGSNTTSQRLKATNLTNGANNTTATVNLSGAGGGDLELTGNYTDNAVFNANARAVFFTGTGTQTIGGTASAPFNIDYVVVTKASGSVQLLTDLLAGAPNTGNALTLTSSTAILDLNGHELTIGTSGLASSVSGSGVIKGSAASGLVINGTGALGTVSFDQTTGGVTNALANLTINRTSTGSVTLGNNLNVSTAATFTAGVLNVNGNTLGLAGTVSTGGGTITQASGTTIFDGSSAQSIPSGIYTSNAASNITIANAAGVTFNGSVAVSGTFQVNSSALFTPVAAAVISGGTLQGSSNSTSIVQVTRVAGGGDFFNQYSFTTRTLTNLNIEFIGASAQTINSTTYGGLKISNNSGVTMGGTVTVGAGLNLNTGFLSIAGNSLVLNGAVTRTSGTITGSIASSVTVNSTAGSLFFTPIVSGNTNNYLKTLTIGASGSATLGDSLNITAFDGTSSEGVLTVTSGGTLATGGFLTLKSSASGTARVAPGATGGSYVTGAVTVERYIPQNTYTGWRLLAANTSGQSINAAWQEGQADSLSNTKPGFGIMVSASGTSHADVVSRGFDGQTPGPSLKYYDAATDALPGISNTLTTNFNTYPGYFVYIRGDRSPGQFNTGGLNRNVPATTSTTLRSKGTIYQGNQSAVTVAYAPPFIYDLLKNPYPSRLDMRQITVGTGMVDAFQVWDPKLVGSHGFGAYQTFTRSGANYVVTPGNGSYGSSGSTQNFIESGAAFFVQAASGTNNTITISESSKASGSSEVNRPSGTLEVGSALITNLYAKNANSTDLADGNMIEIDPAFSNDIDILDVRKSANLADNFGIVTAGADLVVERRALFTVNDTVFFKITALRRQDYQLAFAPTAITIPALGAFLQDSYLGSETFVDLNSNTTYDFTVNSDAGSSRSNRFRLVFRPIVIVPVTFTGIRAQQSGNNIAVEWKVTNQLNIASYEVMKSTDGLNFTSLATQQARNINSGIITYNWLDENAVAGANYYRIKSVDRNGQFKYTDIVKVMLGKGAPSISVSPNPILGNHMQVQFVNEAAGKYNIRLFNTAGQLMYTNVAQHAGGSASQSFDLPLKVVRGVYQLEITGPDNNKQVQKLIINPAN